jgi:hypothetical protein
MGTGGSNLQRTIGRKAPLPRALGEPAELTTAIDARMPGVYRIVENEVSSMRKGAFALTQG